MEKVSVCLGGRDVQSRVREQLVVNKVKSAGTATGEKLWLLLRPENKSKNRANDSDGAVRKAAARGGCGRVLKHYRHHHHHRRESSRRNRMAAKLDRAKGDSEKRKLETDGCSGGTDNENAGPPPLSLSAPLPPFCCFRSPDNEKKKEPRGGGNGGSILIS